MRFSIKTIMLLVALAALIAWAWSISWQLAMPFSVVVLIWWLITYDEEV